MSLVVSCSTFAWSKKNVFIESFCFQQGVPYELFNKWFSSRKKSIVPVDIIGIPEEGHVEEADYHSLASCPNPASPSSVETVVISLSNGVQISKRNLSYVDLCRLGEKLEVLC